MSKECCGNEQTVVKQPAHSHGKTSNGHDHDHDHDHGHDHGSGTVAWYRTSEFIMCVVSLLLLLTGILLDHTWTGFTGYKRLGFYLLAYLPVALPVVVNAWRTVLKGDIFSEFLLMTIATVGAFYIGQYPEGVAVMLFYAVGEVFQDAAVSRAKGNIKSLLDQRPDEVNVLENGILVRKAAANVPVGTVLQLKPGEKLALDGILLTETATFNTAALTGESKPDTMVKGDAVLAGMINLNTVTDVQVTTAYADSKLSRILELVQNASAQKAPTELFIRKFARIYTPAVVFLAVGICLLPYFFVANYVFDEWLYRALIFLVISCPCALVISIPLGYFGGIGAASRNGILFKGSNYLDVMANVKNVVMDKTGTLTKGVFAVQEVLIQPGFEEKELLQWVNAIEGKSTHPVATAIREYLGDTAQPLEVTGLTEIAGHGLKGSVAGKELLAGNFRLLKKFNVSFDISAEDIPLTVVAIAVDGKYAGLITIADEIKEDAQQAIRELNEMDINTVMLSGDKSSVVKYVAERLGVEEAYGDLLPEDKVEKVKAIRAEKGSVAFVGDGVNDAPVIALSDAGLAMGGLGSDAAIETADIVIQNDQPSRISMAVRIGRATKQIVWQNITLAFVVKGVVLLLGAGGLATMWEAVFADVGVALLAIMNAIRIQRKQF
ncbi:heavy metal translocating P-type ATPase [Chitinophaga sp. Cy-1792]|uniref:heavy metal translocating P-type ATPase n=1 Tax=Chitinophaga sp. Cy-1792 TaxID=2608339 RepID=UPI00141E4383|nr:heavy metal translocating P-type ATPase [Chitinophaga sp. Cy-1792]NIG56146.1 cadmium-translocating P-type ATPase [Chitinophaga sp. Cy-1792]